MPTKLLEKSPAWPAFSAREAVSPAGYCFHLVPILSFLKNSPAFRFTSLYRYHYLLSCVVSKIVLAPNSLSKDVGNRLCGQLGIRAPDPHTPAGLQGNAVMDPFPVALKGQPHASIIPLLPACFESRPPPLLIGVLVVSSTLLRDSR